MQRRTFLLGGAAALLLPLSAVAEANFRARLMDWRATAQPTDVALIVSFPVACGGCENDCCFFLRKYVAAFESHWVAREAPHLTPLSQLAPVPPSP
jgi:hypothetical protein